MVDDRQLLKLYVGMTPRQREVLQLVSTGLSNRQAAEQLYVAPSVVAFHLTCIYEALASLDKVPQARPKRYLLIQLYGDFFRRYPELDNFVQ